MTRGLGLILLLAVGCAPAQPEEVAVSPAPETGPAAPIDPPMSVGFSKTLALQGITFRVSCPNQGSLNQLRVEPEGLAADNSPMVQEVSGTVMDAEVADLDADGSPEIYVYVTGAGSGSHGSVVAYGANDHRSLSGIYLPEITDDRAAGQGYMGHDTFAIVGTRLVRSFPLYRETDTNVAPTGGTREVSYRLVAGEAGWLLRVDRIVDR